MTSTTFFLIFIPFLAFILLAINLIFAPHNPYQEKDSAFECGFHSFLGQNRTQFSISFFIFALLFLLFDLEILLVYPYIVSAYTNSVYGLVVMLAFFLILTLGFAFELGKNALKIDSRQMFSFSNKRPDVQSYCSSMTGSLLISIDELPFFKPENYIYLLAMLIIATIIAISLALLILFSTNESTSNVTEELTNDDIFTYHRDDYQCEHYWRAHKNDIICGFHVSASENPCKNKGEYAFKCSICGEIRCGTHAQAHYPRNSGPTRGNS